MHVRPAVPDDAEAIERARIRGWQVAYRHVFPPDELDRLPIDWSRWRAHLEQGAPHECLVCEHDGAVVGWVTLGATGEPEVGEIQGLYVDPDSWSTGAGRALIQQAESVLARDFAAGVLWVLEANERARRFYEAAGWSVDGRRGTFERFGVRAPIVRYGKSLSNSTSRS